MAMTMTELKRLEQKVAVLEKRVAKLEGKNGTTKTGKRALPKRVRAQSANERERAREILRRAGVTREPTAEEKRLAAEWNVLSEARKSYIIGKTHTLQLNPPLSETILQERE